MQHAMAATASRTVWLSRLLLTVAVALVLGVTLADNVDASKKGKKTIASVKDRIQSQRDVCELIGGGTLDVTTLPSGTKTTFCKGGTKDGTYCKHTQKESTCRCNNTGQDGECNSAVTAPPPSGPAAPPTGGANEDPTGGNNAGTAAPPGASGEADPNSGEAEPPTIQ